MCVCAPLLVWAQPTGLNARYNYGNLTGLGVNIYVVDTGLYLDHAEFGGPAGPSRAKWGADCTSGTCLTAFPPADARAASGDCEGHGTHVAGIAAGRCGCGVSVCGSVCVCECVCVCPQARKPCPVVNCARHMRNVLHVFCVWRPCAPPL